MKQRFMVWNFSLKIHVGTQKFQVLGHFGVQIFRLGMLNLYDIKRKTRSEKGWAE
jgi:hypothetical protein